MAVGTIYLSAIMGWTSLRRSRSFSLTQYFSSTPVLIPATANPPIWVHRSLFSSPLVWSPPAAYAALQWWRYRRIQSVKKLLCLHQVWSEFLLVIMSFILVVPLLDFALSKSRLDVRACLPHPLCCVYYSTTISSSMLFLKSVAHGANF